MSRELPKLAEGEVMLPDRMRLTPSAISPWRATRGPDQFFTWNQLHLMPEYQLDADTCDVVLVRSVTSQSEWYAGLYRPQPVLIIPCPVLRRSGEKVYVLSPAGMKKWVYADGSITRKKPAPERERRSHWRRQP